jgi:single-strand DNA-binding protein
MAAFNKVILLGNLTRDPQFKTLSSGTAVADFGIAMNRKFTQQGEQREEVTFVDVTAFGKQAETINQYCRKGKQLLIEGRLKYDTWEDKQGGKRSKLSVVVDGFQFVGGESADNSATPKQRNARAVPNTVGHDEQFRDDDIPF